MPELPRTPETWPHIFVPGPGRVILALHGTGGTEQQGVELAQKLDPGAAILSPRGLVNEAGANRWFRREAEGVFDVADVVYRAGELAAFVRWARDEYELAKRELVVTGFSNGANMALACALKHPETVSQTIAFSGMYPFGDRGLSTDLAGCRIVLLNGDNDAMAPRSSVARLVSEARAAGADVTVSERPGGHGITENEIVLAQRWLASIPRVAHS